MTPPRIPPSWLAPVLMIVALLADIAAVALIVALVRAGQAPPIDVYTIGGIAVGAAYAIIGWLIAARRPENSIGWIFLAIALSQTIGVFATAYATYGLTVAVPVPPFAVGLSWVAVWSWVPGFVLLVTVSVLLFPDGRPPSPRWRPVVWASFAIMALLLVPVAIATWPFRGEVLLGSIEDVQDAGLDAAHALQTVGIVAIPFVAALSLAGMVVRFRRAGQTERQQLKWFTFAAVPELVFVVSSGYIEWPPAIAIVASIVIAPLVPVAAAIAILRYRLYDIDRIVSRTIAYAAITGVLAIVFTGVILVLSSVLTSIAQGAVPSSQGRTIAVAVSTLIVFAVFQPVRRGIGRVVDRRFDRARYDADRTVAAFSDRLRDDIDLDAIGREIVATATTAVRPSTAAIWLRASDR